jgi:hypothetical protein
MLVYGLMIALIWPANPLDTLLEILFSYQYYVTSVAGETLFKTM